MVVVIGDHLALFQERPRTLQPAQPHLCVGHSGKGQRDVPTIAKRATLHQTFSTQSERVCIVALEVGQRSRN